MIDFLPNALYTRKELNDLFRKHSGTTWDSMRAKLGVEPVGQAGFLGATILDALRQAPPAYQREKKIQKVQTVPRRGVNPRLAQAMRAAGVKTVKNFSPTQTRAGAA